ncbi:MAG: glycoside hydrolase family 3 C-terminal domain-containing protein [Promethearchaeota archaeon]
MEGGKELLTWKDVKNLPVDEIEKTIDRLISQMTIDEKIEQMNGDWAMPSGLFKMIRYCNPPIPAGAVKRLGIPPFRFTDGPRGIVTGHSTCFPVPMARGATWDVELEERVGGAIGIEARAQGATFFGGVCINILRHPAWGRAQETYSEDPYHLGELGAALVRGVQRHNVMACAKHYALNSMENSRFKVDVSLDERTLREIYLPHFKRCIDTGVASVMGAYNKFRGDQSCESKHLLTTILKDDWKFDGFVITDFLMGVRDGGKGIAAGLDVEMPLKWKMKARKVKKAIKKGTISEEMLDEANRRILRKKFQFLAKEDVMEYGMDLVAREEHVNLALEVAQKSIVLLKNDGDLLPLKLKVEGGIKIAIFGKLANYPNIGDHGSSWVRPPRVITPLQGLKDAIGNKGTIIYAKGKNIKKCQEIARSTDISIIIAGYTHGEEGEYLITKGGDRKSIRLPTRDVKLINAISKTTSKCIVVIEGGSATIINEWMKNVPAIIMAWYPGMAGGAAIAQILLGEVNPSGKLPCTIPASEDHLPFFKRSVKRITYEYHHGYRLLDRSNIKPDFAFGYGLSYTTFRYSNLKLANPEIDGGGKINASVDVENTGRRAGEEIVQLYVSCKKSSVDRAVKDLKAFKRIALAPGEKKTTTLEVDASQLAYFDEGSGKWVVEPGEYEILVGPSSLANDLLSTKLNVTCRSQKTNIK